MNMPPDSSLRFPACVGNRKADAAGPVTGGPRVLFGEEEDPVGDIAAPSDGTQCGGAVEAAVDVGAAVGPPPPCAGGGARVTLGDPKDPRSAHHPPFVLGH